MNEELSVILKKNYLTLILEKIHRNIDVNVYSVLVLNIKNGELLILTK